MKRTAPVLVVIAAALLLGVLWLAGVFNDPSAQAPLGALSKRDESRATRTLEPQRAAIVAEVDEIETVIELDEETTQQDDAIDSAKPEHVGTKALRQAPVPRAPEPVSAGPQLLSHYLSDTGSAITLATQLVLVFDQPLAGATVGGAHFDIAGSQAGGALWFLQRKTLQVSWGATGSAGTQSSGELTLHGIDWNTTLAWVPEGLVAAEDAEPGDQGWADRVVEPQSGIVFCLIPSGLAEVGMSNAAGAVTLHSSIRIERPFYMARTETTQAQWRAVRGVNRGTQLGDDFPVDSVSWHEAQSFCESIGARLPDNLQWEYACRAGSRKEYSIEDPITLDQAKCLDIEKVRAEGVPDPRNGSQAAAVASYPPNAWGLYDMFGNLEEWTARGSSEREVIDWAPILAIDPDCELRSMRGGSWTDLPQRL